MTEISYNILTGIYDPAPDHTLVIPAPCDWLNANNRRRIHWSQDSRLTATWRQTAGWAARAAKLPALGPSRVIAELHVKPRRRSRIDPSNYAPTAKPCIDGLVDVGIWPDDSADWVYGPDMRLGPPVKSEALVLLIFGQPCCADATCLHQRRPT